MQSGMNRYGLISGALLALATIVSAAGGGVGGGGPPRVFGNGPPPPSALVGAGPGEFHAAARRATAANLPVQLEVIPMDQLERQTDHSSAWVGARYTPLELHLANSRFLPLALHRASTPSQSALARMPSKAPTTASFSSRSRPITPPIPDSR